MLQLLEEATLAQAKEKARRERIAEGQVRPKQSQRELGGGVDFRASLRIIALVSHYVY